MTDNAADFRGGERHAFTLAVPANFRARRRYDNELILVEVRPPADDLARLFLTDVDVADDEAVGLRVRADRDGAVRSARGWARRNDGRARNDGPAPSDGRAPSAAAPAPSTTGKEDTTT